MKSVPASALASAVAAFGLLAPRPLAALAAGADFLNAAVPARPASMAGAFGAFNDDAVAFLWNPGALGKVPGPLLSATHFLSIVDTEFDQAAYVEPLRVWNSDAGLGFDMQYDTTTNFNQIDAQGNDLGPVANYDLLVDGGGGLSLGSGVRLGASAKLFDSRLAEFKDQGYAVDLGGQDDLTDRLTLGMALLNFGNQGAFDQVADPLPTRFSLSARYALVTSDLVTIQTAAEMDRFWSVNNPSTLGFGAEYWYAGTLVFRAGWLFGSTAGPFSLGVGLRWQSVTFDYAYDSLGDLGMTNRFSMTLALASLFERLGWTVDPIGGSRPASTAVPVHVSIP